MRQAIYTRVSDDDQSLESQHHDIKQWLETHPLPNPKWYEDHGKTGRNLQRPAMQQLRDDIRAGKIDSVICQRIDRLSRTTIDGLTLLAEWGEAGIRIVSIKQQLDLQGPVGKLMAAVLLAVGEMELEMRRERQASGIAAARKKGVYKGRTPGTTKANPAKALELFNRGLTIKEVASALGVSITTTQDYIRNQKQCSQSSATQPETASSLSSPAS